MVPTGCWMGAVRLLPLWEILQYQQVGLTQAPFKLPLLPLAREILCVPFKNGVSISPSPP